MTRPSKRELEREVEVLREVTATGSLGSDSPPADEWYTEEVKRFVYGIGRDIIALGCTSSLGTIGNPERTVGILERVRERYGIDEDRDEAVHATLKRTAERADTHWQADDSLAPSVIMFPHGFAAERREQWDRAFEGGDEELAACMIVQATYRSLADQDTRGIPA